MASTRDLGANPYDEVPYEGWTYAETHPDVLATAAALRGLDPPCIEGARVLELGCGDGANLLAMAYTLPGARFTGIDLSRRQIESGREMATALGLENVRLEAMDLLELGDEFGSFDYIVAHGVYSWIPEQARAKLLEVVRRNLSARGVAYVSYNTYPGWHFRGIVRDLMRFHVPESADPRERAAEARRIVKIVHQAASCGGGPYAEVLRREIVHCDGERDAYLLHEFMEPVNEPIDFTEFIRRAGSHGLRYLGDGRPHADADHQPAWLRETLGQLSSDVLRREQYFDYVCNRSFRRSLLCHVEQEPTPRILPEHVIGLRTTAAPQLRSSSPASAPAAGEAFQSATSEPVTTAEPVLRALLQVHIERFPRSLSFDELQGLVKERTENVFEGSLGGAGVTREALASFLLEAYRANLVGLRTFEPRIPSEPGERPAASAVARQQARTGSRVTNLLHCTVILSEFERLVIRRLDGRRDRSELLTDLVEAVVSGEFELVQAGRRLAEPHLVRPVLERSLEPCLGRFLGSALLL